MFDKILIVLYFPASGKYYEMRVPVHLKVGHVTQMLIEFFGKDRNGGYVNGEYVPTKDAVLCDEATGQIFNANAFVGEVGWKDGTRIFMI